MSDQLALLRAVAEHEDDDTPRLVYADWLQENGQPERAEFIRLQCEWFSMRPADPRFESHRTRIDALLRKHRSKWLKPFGKEFAAAAGFDRGFVSSVKLPAAALDLRNPPPWHLEPCAWVWLEGPEEAVTRVLPAAAGAYGLAFDLDDPLLEEDDEADPDDFDVPDPDFPGDRLASAVAAVPGFARLRALYLSGEELSDAGAAALAASHLRDLRELHLGWNWLTADGWKALADSPLMSGLRELDLTTERCTEREMTGYAYPGNRGAAALASSSRAGNLRVLKLGDCGIGKAGAAALSASPHLAELEELDLNGLDWRAPALGAFLAGDPFPRLRKLDLSMNRFGAAEARLLARSSLLPRLAELDLGFCELNDAAVAELLAAPDLSRLEDLNLIGNEFGETGVEALARCEKFTGLRRLCLSHVPLKRRAADVLLAAPWLDRLEDLSLTGTKLPKSARDRLAKRLGKVVSFR